ncbi:MAG: RIP metalloprotease RseP [Bacteroidales bacterium]|jgi:regulator of sigma E protease|nr:RIP metalloprotease RseP [Bacteroidales bacterium]
METAVRIAQLLVSLSLLIICHEFGHFITAKIFKTKVEKFFLFFDPWFHIFSFKKGETEYGIGWLPLGGYVKIAGMVDESMDTESMKKDPQPWEFRSKPAWQRLIIMLAGVIVNVILAMSIYAMVAFHWGSSYLPVENLKEGISVDSLGLAVGLQNGDKIKLVNGEKVDDYNKVLITLLLNDPKSLTVERNGKDTTVVLSDENIAEILKGEHYFISPRYPFQIAEMPEESPAKAAGFQVNDFIIAVNDVNCQYFSEVRDAIQNNINKEVNFRVLRGTDSLNITMTIPQDGKIKVMTEPPTKFLEIATIQYGFFESFPVGIARGWEKTKEYVKQFKLIFNPDTEAYKSVGSFISMAKIFPGSWDWYSFWNLTALFSIMLAVLNVLPIPGLDGGHALFTIIEMITGKTPSLKFQEVTQTIGMILLLLLMVYAIGNDFIRHVFN